MVPSSLLWIWGWWMPISEYFISSCCPSGRLSVRQEELLLPSFCQCMLLISFLGETPAIFNFLPFLSSLPPPSNSPHIFCVLFCFPCSRLYPFGLATASLTSLKIMLVVLEVSKLSRHGFLLHRSQTCYMGLIPANATKSLLVKSVRGWVQWRPLCSVWSTCLTTRLSSLFNSKSCLSGFEDTVAYWDTGHLLLHSISHHGPYCTGDCYLNAAYWFVQPPGGAGAFAFVLMCLRIALSQKLICPYWEKS